MNLVRKVVWGIGDAAWALDRLLYDRKLLVYGDWKQQCLAMAIGCATGLVLGTLIVYPFI